MSPVWTGYERRAEKREKFALPSGSHLPFHFRLPPILSPSCSCAVYNSLSDPFLLPAGILPLFAPNQLTSQKEERERPSLSLSSAANPHFAIEKFDGGAQKGERESGLPPVHT